MSAISYVANVANVSLFANALAAKDRSIRDMGLACLREVAGSADVKEAAIRHAALVAAVRDKMVKAATAAVRSEVFTTDKGETRTARDQQAMYDAGSFSREASEFFRKLKGITVNGSKIAKVWKAGFDRADVAEGIALFLAGELSFGALAALEARKDADAAPDAAPDTAPDAAPDAAPFTVEQFRATLVSMLTGAEAAGFLAEALAATVEVSRDMATKIAS